MTIRFHWLAEPPDFTEDRYAEPPPWPQQLLQRHRGRVLRPAEAAPSFAGHVVESTAYRGDTLLLPDSLASDEDARTKIGDLIGCTLTPPPSLLELLDGDDDRAARLRELPRPVTAVLKPGQAVPFDPWSAVQTIRSSGPGLDLTDEQKEDLQFVSLDHLLAGTRFGGVPTYEPQDPRVPAYPGGYAPEGRHPVSAVVTQPDRDGFTGPRRPVIAVLDTGVRGHPWFGDLQSGFVRADLFTQSMIAKHQPQVAGLPRTDVLDSAVDEPVYAEELADRVNPATGHGSFIIGVIHQHAPHADVRSVRVLRPDNVGYESDLLLALWILADEVRLAQQGQGQMIDVVSLSLGYYDETWLSDTRTRLTDAVERLTKLGVVVVASAGNDSSKRAFLPAALSSLKPADPRVPPVVGVGALNPNGTTSWYSNGGVSASCEAPGTCVISTYPPDVRGSGGPASTAPSVDRETVDQDDYRSGFAMWSGTSFAAPRVAAELANRLMKHDLGEIDLETTKARARDVLRALSAETWEAEVEHLGERVSDAATGYELRLRRIKEQVERERKAAEG